MSNPDPKYLRKESSYAIEAFTFSLSRLRSLGSDYTEESVGTFLQMLEMYASSELGKSTLQTHLEDERIQRDIE